ncbi:hypothetical protein TNIN_464801 [Trichonephila inaurata madagascariensis]|uniref:Uncharacterized protein n=1 Tax=Trichonephila inaurata madagascariensis TaxID=2747483 RepID=A0A8X6I7G6_9ARAC|nr:hypothetical protein TNIN_464801 [Trichonephila inaurata madagascariensis]
MATVDVPSRPPHCTIIQTSVHLQFLKAQPNNGLKNASWNNTQDTYITKENKLLNKTLDDSDLLVVPDEMKANIFKTADERGHFASNSNSTFQRSIKITSFKLIFGTRRTLRLSNFLTMR